MEAAPDGASHPVVTPSVNWPAVAWTAGAVLLLAFFLLLPCSTWPEQLALAGTLFGAAVVGGWALGLGVEIAARLVWLVRLVRHWLRPIPRPERAAAGPAR